MQLLTGWKPVLRHLVLRDLGNQYVANGLFSERY